jgi:hypothetical protein
MYVFECLSCVPRLMFEAIFFMLSGMSWESKMNAFENINFLCEAKMVQKSKIVRRKPTIFYVDV